MLSGGGLLLSPDLNYRSKRFSLALKKCRVQCRLVKSSVVVWPTGDLGATEISYLIYLVVPNVPVTTATIFVLTFHILLTPISKSLYFLNFSLSFILKFESSDTATWIGRHAVLYHVGTLVLCDLL